MNAERRIRDALGSAPQTTEVLQRIGICSLGEAVEILQRLEAQGVARRARNAMNGMTWRATASSYKQGDEHA